MTPLGPRPGLAGAPPVRVLVGERRHVSVDRALRFLGVGRASLTVVPSDSWARMDVARLRELLGEGPAIVCAQAGEINTGAFDELDAVADLTTRAFADAFIRVTAPRARQRAM
ncbi:hypothetical protein ACIBQ1_27270 [Nonomuraea sp. NPDC050153]|uniref:hypothetical protein n=1 Tax=Nonomuraea sp. NPDC050153 TaxID=3364359 RepID=UPI0037BC0698